MKFAPIAPIGWHPTVRKWGMQSGVYLLLAHDVLARPKEYETYFRPWPEGTLHVIMDNSVVELGSAIPFRQVLEAARIVNADIVVAPDVPHDMVSTLLKVTTAHAELRDARDIDEMAIMTVVQGCTEAEYVACAERLQHLLDPDWFAIPRSAQHDLKSRYPVTERIARLGKPIHLLGFSNDVGDDIYTGYHIPEVYSIDSALPVWYGARGELLDHHPTRNNSYGKRPPNFFSLGDSGAEIPMESIMNVQLCRMWCQRGG